MDGNLFDVVQDNKCLISSIFLYTCVCIKHCRPSIIALHQIQLLSWVLVWDSFHLAASFHFIVLIIISLGAVDNHNNEINQSLMHSYHCLLSMKGVSVTQSKLQSQWVQTPGTKMFTVPWDKLTSSNWPQSGNGFSTDMRKGDEGWYAILRYLGQSFRS